MTSTKTTGNPEPTYDRVEVRELTIPHALSLSLGGQHSVGTIVGGAVWLHALNVAEEQGWTPTSTRGVSVAAFGRAGVVVRKDGSAAEDGTAYEGLGGYFQPSSRISPEDCTALARAWAQTGDILVSGLAAMFELAAERGGIDIQ